MEGYGEFNVWRGYGEFNVWRGYGECNVWRDMVNLTCGGDMVSLTCGGDIVSLMCDDKIQRKWEVLYDCVTAHVYTSICVTKCHVLSPGCNRPPTSPWSSPSTWIPQSTSGTRQQETDKFNSGTYSGTCL